MTAGEKRFAKRLKDLLPDDCLCWYDIPVGSRRKRPDFIVLLPEHGLLVLEVKDWKPKTIKEVDPQQITISTHNGEKVVDHPLEQARKYIFPVTKILEADDKLKQVKARHKGKLCFPYGYGAVLTNITRLQLHKMLDDEERDRVLPDRYLICKDEMTESVVADDLQQRILAMFDYNFGKTLTKEQVDRIRWHLFPEIRVKHDQLELFSEKADDGTPVAGKSAISQLMPDMVRLMDIQQEQLARGLGEGHRVIHGVAGSGKTVILYHRCMYLAEFLKRPILVLCFNITLSKAIHTEIQRRVVGDKVEVLNFHSWCAQQLGKHNVKLIDGEEDEFSARQVESVIQAVEQGKIPKHQYGAVMIDEGHDFEPEWLKLVVQMTDAKNPSLLLLYDNAQSIYKCKSSLKFSLASVGIKAQGRTSILKINYRNTRQILEFAYQFAKQCFSAASENEDMPLLKPEMGGNEGDRPMVKNCPNVDVEIQYVLGLVQKWVKESKTLSDTAIIYANKPSGKQMAEILKEHQVPCQLLATQEGKKLYDPDGSIVIMPIPSSKGLEFERVIILDATHIIHRNRDDIMATVRLLYVAMTRARKQLFISYHQYNEIAEMLQQVQE